MTARRKTARDAASPGNRSVDEDLVAARRVLEIEAESLRALADGLDGAFTRAVDVLSAIRGRVVVSGMGKSGHIGRKVASTMASTGTPALYVHPGEASHGDLGMITRNDAVLLLSNSGETPELADIITYTRRFFIPLVVIVGRAESALARLDGEGAPHVALVLPTRPEACPMGLAPTTSTAMMLALGDALAVALLERRGFSADDFRVLHPGGHLAEKSLVRVRDIMHRGKELPLVGLETRMSEALLVMTSKSFGCLGILDADGVLAGIITDGDLRRHMDANLLELSARDAMTPAPKTIRPQALTAEALGTMNAAKITNLFVVEDGRPIGIVHIHDCLRVGAA